MYSSECINIDSRNLFKIWSLQIQINHHNYREMFGLASRSHLIHQCSTTTHSLESLVRWGVSQTEIMIQYNVCNNLDPKAPVFVSIVNRSCWRKMIRRLTSKTLTVLTPCLVMILRKCSITLNIIDLVKWRQKIFTT